MVLADGLQVAELSAYSRATGNFVLTVPLLLERKKIAWELAEFPNCSEFAVLLHESTPTAPR